ncbi:hypothetical protein VTN77DRAFT_8878 [Rasamsonia byssochlamydoides]|uniref:uncharacterized protein n=1 Tax=Rasamsonia byssochlamydoides TaxID=89139 RepID=UPI0037426825
MQTERKGIRSRTGCWTCRERKIKCDETRPVCQRCTIGKRVCDYTSREPPPRRPTTVRAILPRTDPAGSVGGIPSASGGIAAGGIAAAGIAGIGAAGSVNPLSPESVATSVTTAPAASFARPSDGSPLSQSSLDGSVKTPPTPPESESRFTVSQHGSPIAIHTSPSANTPPDHLPGGLGELHASTPQEKRVLDHFQTQFLTTMQTKTAKYSFVAGIMHICKSSPVLMHMMMAIVGYQASGLYESREEQLFAIDEYRKGLAGFATLVGSGQYERHTLLAAFWILIQFEMRFGQRPRDITHHLDGFNSVLLSHGPSLLPQLIDTSKKNPEYDPSRTEFQYPFRTSLVTYKNVVNRLGLWIAYLDACAASFDMGGAIMATMQYKYPGSLDRIFAHSRDALKELWGDEYPREQEVDDIQNRPAFDLFHHCHILRFKVAELRWDKSVGNARAEKIRDLHAEIHAIAEQYASLIAIVEGRDPSMQPTSRLVKNLRFIVATFHAVVLEFNRVAYFHAPLPPEGRRAVERILDLAVVVHECEGNDSLTRLAWPMFLAGIEAWDRVHQNWLTERLQALCGYGRNVTRAHRLLEAVVRRQRSVPGRVDYFKWFRSGEAEEFILV